MSMLFFLSYSLVCLPHFESPLSGPALRTRLSFVTVTSILDFGLAGGSPPSAVCCAAGAAGRTGPVSAGTRRGEGQAPGPRYVHTWAHSGMWVASRSTGLGAGRGWSSCVLSENKLRGRAWSDPGDQSIHTQRNHVIASLWFSEFVVTARVVEPLASAWWLHQGKLLVRITYQGSVLLTHSLTSTASLMGEAAWGLENLESIAGWPSPAVWTRTDYLTFWVLLHWSIKHRW